ncbi:SufD family Fe-S cluster assembly protein [Candidatus Woesearchaeota archaeon]|nr:SufD family Fe-S cluster assembly protein [Candidatus Woesearchaeota archaeon]
MDVAVQKYPELVKKYFMSSCVPINDHKFVMLHAAVWSGGTFIYVPPNTKVDLPLQAYFRMNAQMGGQFEHTLIIVDKNSELHYIEGCSAPQFNESALHAGCVELHVMEGARMRYSSVENWSKNTFNLNTKRALVYRNATVEWINANLGCLTGDTKVFTNHSGPQDIKDIKPGEYVYVLDEKTNRIKKSRVMTKMFSGYKKVYRLEAGGREIEATANHPFLALTRTKNKESHKKAFFHAEWKPVETLKEGDMIAVAKKLPIEGQPYQLPKVKIGNTIESGNQYARFKMDTSHLYNERITIPNRTSDEFMWIAGLLMGDGHISLKSNKVNIATHQKEDFRDLLCKTIKTLFNCEVNDKEKRCIELNSRAICCLFIDIGFGGKADTKRIPNWIFGLPESQILAFLAGYFDSDGHAATYSIAFTSINKELLQDTKLLGISVGFSVSRIFKHSEAGEVKILGKKCKAKGSWRVLFNGKKIKELPTKSRKKKEKIDKINTRRSFSSSASLNFKSKTNEEIGFSRIEKIIEIGIKPTFDIEVEKYHNFIANGLIVHNSGTTMLYPCSVLLEDGARSDSLGIAFAGEGQNQDTGSKVIHVAPNTSSFIKAKSISKGGGITSYRGYVKVTPKAKNATCSVQCDALLIDERSVSNTYPFMKIDSNKVDIAHEATVGKIGEEEIFYLMSRGLSEEEATRMVVSGFIEPIVKQLPLEYAVELNKLIELEMEGCIG